MACLPLLGHHRGHRRGVPAQCPGWKTTIAFAGVEVGVWLIIGAVLVVAAVGGFVDTFRGKLLFGFL